MNDPEQLKKQAKSLLQAGNTGAAGTLLVKLSSSCNQDAEVWFLLGAIHGQQGDYAQAIQYSRRAISLNPDYADAHYNLGQACLHEERFDEALTSFRAVLRVQPGNRAAAGGLAHTLLQLGHYHHCRKNTGKAIACYEEAVVLQPRDSRTLLRLGLLYSAMGMSDVAVGWLDRALQTEPDSAELHLHAGKIYKKLYRLQKASDALNRAIRLDPTDMKAHQHIGGIYLAQGLQAQAAQHYRTLLKTRPDSLEFLFGLMWALNYISTDQAAMFTLHRQWAALFCKDRPAQTAHPNEPLHNRPIRIGYVSPDFCAHSVANFIAPVLKNHARKDFEIVCYSDSRKQDLITGRLQRYAHRWRDIAGQSDDEVIETIHNDKIDILVDLAGHSGNHRLSVFARKPAPIQVTYLGYPNTTGLDSIDYRLIDEITDPTGDTDAYCSETLVRLPGVFLCYKPLLDCPDVSELPAAKTGHITFGSFNNLAKVTPQVLNLWATLLRESPGSRLVLKNESLSDEAVRRRITGVFADQGINEDRLTLVGWEQTFDAHLAWYAKIDIGLDTFPYCGTTTTCEALWMGVPVITLAGQTHASRVGMTLLSQVGLDDFVARDEAGYAAVARDCVSSPDRLASLRSALRARMQAAELCDGAGFTQKLESAFREMWVNRCNGGKPT